MPAFPDPESRNVLEPGCDRCPALVESRERIAWGNGDADADLMVVGEAPAAGVEPRSTESASGDEPRAGNPDADRWQGGNHTGMAYTSRHSGRRVRELVADLGFDPADCYFTNAVKCFPEAADGEGSNREPTAAERANCRGHLETELAQVDPAVVLATGKHATLSVLAGETTELDGFLDAVLEPVDCPNLGVTLLPVLHPSYLEVWLSRLGYDYEGYVAAMREQVTAVLA